MNEKGQGSSATFSLKFSSDGRSLQFVHLVVPEDQRSYKAWTLRPVFEDPEKDEAAFRDALKKLEQQSAASAQGFKIPFVTISKKPSATGGFSTAPNSSPLLGTQNGGAVSSGGVVNPAVSRAPPHHHATGGADGGGTRESGPKAQPDSPVPEGHVAQPGGSVGTRNGESGAGGFGANDFIKALEEYMKELNMEVGNWTKKVLSDVRDALGDEDADGRTSAPKQFEDWAKGFRATALHLPESRLKSLRLDLSPKNWLGAAVEVAASKSRFSRDPPYELLVDLYLAIDPTDHDRLAHVERLLAEYQIEKFVIETNSHFNARTCELAGEEPSDVVTRNFVVRTEVPGFRYSGAIQRRAQVVVSTGRAM